MNDIRHTCAFGIPRLHNTKGRDLDVLASAFPTSSVPGFPENHSRLIEDYTSIEPRRSLRNSCCIRMESAQTLSFLKSQPDALHLLRNTHNGKTGTDVDDITDQMEKRDEKQQRRFQRYESRRPQIAIYHRLLHRKWDLELRSHYRSKTRRGTASKNSTCCVGFITMLLAGNAAGRENIFGIDKHVLAKITAHRPIGSLSRHKHGYNIPQNTLLQDIWWLIPMRCFQW
ncbi:hypothetical protein K440DRAFT_643338 [Wilcoxina mikolae CBS 423.85]|nr:hypothetical protein K440DRAFT_643338 [Wilcoxina mikolae CBS 423.85]